MVEPGKVQGSMATWFWFKSTPQSLSVAAKAGQVSPKSTRT